MHQRSPLYPTPGALASSTSEISHDQYGKELVELFKEEGTVGELWEAVGQPWVTVCSFLRDLDCLLLGENLLRTQARHELCPTGKTSPVSFPSIHVSTSVQRLAVSPRQHCLVFSNWAKHYDTLCLNLLLHTFTAKQHTFQLDSMSSDRKGKARAHSPILPESGQSASEQLSHPASGHAQATQVTESSRNLGVPTTPYGQAQAHSAPQAATSGHQKDAEIGDRIFDSTQDHLIIKLVAMGWTFDQIKTDDKFSDVPAVTPWLLEVRAQTLRAFWTKQEDDLLSAMELGENEKYDNLVRLKVHFKNPERQVWDIQNRYNYLKSWREGQGAGGQAQAAKPPNGQRHSARGDDPSSPAYGSYGQQSYPSTPGQASVHTAASTQGLAGTSISSTPNSSHDSAAHQPMTHPQAANPQPGSRLRGRPGGRSGASRGDAEARRKALEARVPEVQVKLARNWFWEEVQHEYCADYSMQTMKAFLRNRGCYHWNITQTDELLRLRELGHDWAYIGQNIGKPKRTPEEAEARFQWRTG